MRGPREQICVVGFGCCTAVGNDAPSTMAAVRAGIAGFHEHPFMISQDGEPYMLAMSPAVDPAVMGARRLVDLGKRAAREALMAIESIGLRQVPVPVFVGLAEARPRMDSEVDQAIAEGLKRVLADAALSGEVQTADKGHAAGLMAMETACRVLRLSEAEFCLTGGVDSYIDPDTLDWVEDNEQLHKPSNAWGFVPGEAAAFCLLCTKATAAAYGLPILCELLDVSTSIERNCIKTETVCIGEGLTDAVASVLASMPSGQQIRYTYCDQNGEAYRADEFGFMLARLSDQFENTDAYMAPADCWGDVGAASGPLFVGLITAAVGKKYAAEGNSLIWTSSESGERSAAVLWAD